MSIEKIITGLAEFSKVFKGKIWLEVFILPGYNYDFNYGDNEIVNIRKAIKKINPDSVQLNTLDRPGTENNLVSASKEQLENIIAMLDMDNVEIIASAHKKHKPKAYRKDLENTILGTISRRPCTIDDLSEILDMPIVELSKYIRILEEENKVVSVKGERGTFYQEVGP